jgi:hypothetical protein
MIITFEFFSFNVWEWFLHSSVLERTESDLSKINWLRGVILLNPIVFGALGQVSIVSHSYQTYFGFCRIRSQSWLWVAWPRDHEVRINVAPRFLNFQVLQGSLMGYNIVSKCGKDSLMFQNPFSYKVSLFILATQGKNGW